MKWDPYFGGIKVDNVAGNFEGFVHSTRSWGWLKKSLQEGGV